MSFVFSGVAEERPKKGPRPRFRTLPPLARAARRVRLICGARFPRADGRFGGPIVTRTDGQSVQENDPLALKEAGRYAAKCVGSNRRCGGVNGARLGRFD